MKKSILYPLIYLGIVILGMMWNGIVVRRIIRVLLIEGGSFDDLQRIANASRLLSLGGSLIASVFVFLILIPLSPRYRRITMMALVQIISIVLTGLGFMIVFNINNISLLVMVLIGIGVMVELLPIGFGVWAVMDRQHTPVIRNALAVYVGSLFIGLLMNGTTGQVIFDGGLLLEANVLVRASVSVLLNIAATAAFIVVLHAIFREEEQYQEMERTVPLADLD